MMTKNERDAALLEIARKTLEIDTLKTENNDRYDFHELAVWTIKKALEQAFEAGQRSMVTAPAPADLGNYILRATPSQPHEFLVERKLGGKPWNKRAKYKSLIIEAETEAEAIRKARACDETCWG